MQQDPSLTVDIAAFRRFNRAYTRFLGTLNDRYLSTEFSLAEGRVLYEVGTRGKTQAKEVAAALGMDAGYLSRLLSKLEKAGLVRRETARQDGRAANLLLTAQGRAAIRTLNLRADRQAKAILGRLSDSQRAQFAGAVQAIQSVVLGERSEPRGATLRTHRPGDMGMVVALEAAGYVEQFGWDGTFEGLAAKIVAHFIENYDPERERCWVAEIDGRHVGHVFLVRDPERADTAKLRLLYVDPSARGQRLGQTLVDQCVTFAREAGYRRITLWTQSILQSAHRIYAAVGFRLVREEPHHTFGHDLIGQTWELDL